MNVHHKQNLLAIFIGISSLLITGCFAVSNFMKKDMVVFASNSSNLINILMDTINIQDEDMDRLQYNDFVLLENTIRNDKRLYALSEKVTPILIHDLLFTSKQDMTFIKDDFIEIMDTYKEDLASYDSDCIIDNKAAVMQNTNAVYQQQVTRIKNRIPTILNLIIMMMYFLSLPIVMSVLLILFITFNLAWYYFYRKTNYSFFPLSLSYLISGSFILFMFFASKIAATAFPSTLLYYIGTIHPSTFYVIGIFGIVYIIMGLRFYMYHKRSIS